ncbi:hypothetical protein F5B21DRAFT_502949 [Xylaria acuta]|nr:hypothetical protein F5B21DRAFT_502949 [Xylaria acuta]
MDRRRDSRAFRADEQAMDEAHDRARSQAQLVAPGTPGSTDTEEEARPKPPPEYTQHYTQFIPHQPMPIPNAVPKERLPVQLEDGTIFMTGSCAPRTEKEIEEIEKADEKERDQNENFRRLQQSAMKHSAFEDKNRATSSTQTPAGSSARTGSANDSDEEEEYPPYHRHVMKPFAHQYGHTTASLAYEEGLKVGAEKARQEKKKEKQELEQAFRTEGFTCQRIRRTIKLDVSGRSHEGIRRGQQLHGDASEHREWSRRNPMAEAQTVDRVHRIGQTLPVTITRCIVPRSIGSYIQWAQSDKLRIINLYLGTIEDAAEVGKKRRERLKTFLR